MYKLHRADYARRVETRDRRRWEHKRKIRHILYESRGCKVCGVRDPEVLDFHHLKDKNWAVSEMRGYAWDKVLKEIAKCEILCSNCHRRRTMRDNWWV